MLILLILTGFLLLALIGALLVSMFMPRHRIWPPPSQYSWQFIFIWVFEFAAVAGIILIGILDWNSLGWPAWLRWSLGLGLIIGGNILAWVGAQQLGVKTTSGAAGPFVTTGVYRYSRNPQYVGNMVLLVGWIVLSASAWVAPYAVLAIGALAITPLTEEPWLHEKYGDAYRSYCRGTPRYFGLMRSNRDRTN